MLTEQFLTVRIPDVRRAPPESLGPVDYAFFDRCRKSNLGVRGHAGLLFRATWHSAPQVSTSTAWGLEYKTLRFRGKRCRLRSDGRCSELPLVSADGRGVPGRTDSPVVPTPRTRRRVGGLELLKRPRNDVKMVDCRDCIRGLALRRLFLDVARIGHS